MRSMNPPICNSLHRAIFRWKWNHADLLPHTQPEGQAACGVVRLMPFVRLWDHSPGAIRCGTLFSTGLTHPPTRAAAAFRTFHRNTFENARVCVFESGSDVPSLSSAVPTRTRTRRWSTPATSPTCWAWARSTTTAAWRSSPAAAWPVDRARQSAASSGSSPPVS